MKQLMAFGFAVILLGLTGCGSENGKTSGHPQIGGKTQKDVFPAFLAGVWEVKTGQYKDKLGVRFEPDGSVLKVLYTAEGPVYIAEGESYGDANGEESYYLFTVDLGEARYAPETRMLKVKIVMDTMIQLTSAKLEGGMNDYFEGPVSEDGKTWEAEWSHYIWFDEKGPPDPNEVEIHPIPLVFTKTDIK
ncbi:MAG: hypothetical protein ABSG99_02955 [Sedimentisphaerales bacterium]